MTVTPPRRSASPTSSELEPKPYELVSFPKNRPVLARPAGHDRYLHDHLHGALFLKLQVQTALHVSTGVVVLGSDVGSSKIPLVKTMTQTRNNQLVIQGSSLKGCVRAIYEAITNSTLAVVTGRYRDKVPDGRSPCRDKEKLCPASRVFGAMDWQGLIQFSDATCRAHQSSVGFMPSLYRPRPDQRQAYFEKGKASGRKFYYTMSGAADKGENRGIPVQQAAKAFIFETVIHYKNLKPEELGVLLIALGQDPEVAIALKLGGGKPIGMGTMSISISNIEQAQHIRERYQQYDLPDSQLNESDLQIFMQKHIKAARNSNLLEKPQLLELAKVLAHPSDRQPPTGMY